MFQTICILVTILMSIYVCFITTHVAIAHPPHDRFKWAKEFHDSFLLPKLFGADEICHGADIYNIDRTNVPA